MARFAQSLRSFASLAGGLYGGVQGFQVRTYITITTRILSFLKLVKYYCWVRKNKIEFLEKKA